jgi:uncharacterized membrane protein
LGNGGGDGSQGIRETVNFTLNFHEFVLLGVLGLSILALIVALHRRSRNPNSRISIDDLLLGSDGRMSKSAAVMFGSFLVTSWVVVFQTLNKTISDITFAAYITAWVVPTVAVLIKTQPASMSTTTVTASSETVTK